MDNFAAQWLQLRNLGRTKPDPQRFPTVDDELLDAMRNETSLFVEAIIKEDRSILDFIDAPFTFVNGPLARHYGIPGVNGEEFQRVTLDGEQRGGLLTQGAILTVSSYPTRTSPPVRGKWVLENLLGARAPAASAERSGARTNPISAQTVSMRERMEQHRKDPELLRLPQPDGPDRIRPRELRRRRRLARHRMARFPIDTSGVAARRQVLQGREGLEADSAGPVRRVHPQPDREAADLRSGARSRTV